MSAIENHNADTCTGSDPCCRGAREARKYYLPWRQARVLHAIEGEVGEARVS